MPLFDFHCRACRRAFEALVRAGYPPACPSCNSTDLERQLPAFAVKTPERSKAAAAANRHRYAVQGQKDTAARNVEAARHKREDH
jgi:putative FmdB family regulatory protein